ncbi:MAG: hypothetical protein NTY63_01400, partial [Candidatus Bipolaricaulota bacterium]|nr:hypothetical protein [Candidatus Bipolaricaulota bacterium]
CPTDTLLGAINSLLPRDQHTAIFFPPDLPSQALGVLADGLYMRRAVRWHGCLETPPHEIGGRRDGVAVRPVDAEVLESNLVGVDDLREIAQLRVLWPELFESGRIWQNAAWRELLLRLEPERDAPSPTADS